MENRNSANFQLICRVYFDYLTSKFKEFLHTEIFVWKGLLNLQNNKKNSPGFCFSDISPDRPILLPDKKSEKLSLI
jgi:hypothetical protein